MKFVTILTIFLSLNLASAESALMNNIKSIDGKELSLNDYKGKLVLAVNIATQCGYTKQLSGLEELHKKYKDKGLVVLGIPSNDFGGQTPEAEGEVKKFCQLNYGVTFPLTAKVKVKGPDKHEFISSMINDSNQKDEIAWNFEKFLINKSGKVIKRFKSDAEPTGSEILSTIEENL